MSGHPRIISYLQRAVNHEFNAMQQYTLQGVLADHLGMGGFATELRKDAQEEVRHAECFIRAMYALGVTPRAGQPLAPRVGSTQAEMLRFGLDTEVEAVRLYREAAHFCERIGDRVHGELFAGILEDEIRHCRELERQLEALGARGG